MQHRAEARRHVHEPEGGVGLEAPIEHSDRHDGQADGKGGGPEPRDLPDRGQEPVGVDDDEPGGEDGQHGAEDPWGPARAKVHRGIIVERA